MKIPLQITVRNLDLSETFKTEIRNKAENLDKFYDQIMLQGRGRSSPPAFP